MPIDLTRAIVTAILDGALANAQVEVDPVFGFAVPRSAAGLPAELLRPRERWDDVAAYDETAANLARDLRANFAQFAGTLPARVAAAGPAPV
jgi:phosphoenolpyruvate carboxykinase (ATP)